MGGGAAMWPRMELLLEFDRKWGEGKGKKERDLGKKTALVVMTE